MEGVLPAYQTDDAEKVLAISSTGKSIGWVSIAAAEVTAATLATALSLDGQLSGDYKLRYNATTGTLVAEAFLAGLFGTPESEEQTGEITGSTVTTRLRYTRLGTDSIAIPEHEDTQADDLPLIIDGTVQVTVGSYTGFPPSVQIALLNTTTGAVTATRTLNNDVIGQTFRFTIPVDDRDDDHALIAQYVDLGNGGTDVTVSVTFKTLGQEGEFSKGIRNIAHDEAAKLITDDGLLPHSADERGDLAPSRRVVASAIEGYSGLITGLQTVVDGLRSLTAILRNAAVDGFLRLITLPDASAPTIHNTAGFTKQVDFRDLAAAVSDAENYIGAGSGVTYTVSGRRFSGLGVGIGTGRHFGVLVDSVADGVLLTAVAADGTEYDYFRINGGKYQLGSYQAAHHEDAEHADSPFHSAFSSQDIPVDGSATRAQLPSVSDLPADGGGATRGTTDIVSMQINPIQATIFFGTTAAGSVRHHFPAITDTDLNTLTGQLDNAPWTTISSIVQPNRSYTLQVRPRRDTGSPERNHYFLEVRMVNVTGDVTARLTDPNLSVTTTYVNHNSVAAGTAWAPGLPDAPAVGDSVLIQATIRPDTHAHTFIVDIHRASGLDVAENDYTLDNGDFDFNIVDVGAGASEFRHARGARLLLARRHRASERPPLHQVGLRGCPAGGGADAGGLCHPRGLGNKHRADGQPGKARRHAVECGRHPDRRFRDKHRHKRGEPWCGVRDGGSVSATGGDVPHQESEQSGHD